MPGRTISRAALLSAARTAAALALASPPRRGSPRS
jgi:hypothetical protein